MTCAFPKKTNKCFHGRVPFISNESSLKKASKGIKNTVCSFNLFINHDPCNNWLEGHSSDNVLELRAYIKAHNNGTLLVKSAQSTAQTERLNLMKDGKLEIPNIYAHAQYDIPGILSVLSPEPASVLVSTETKRKAGSWDEIGIY